MNVFSFTGNLGKDCRTGTAGSASVCNFNVAVKSGYGDREQTLWVDCALWGKRAESGLVKYLTKGQQVAVSGELGTREHEGKTYLTLNVNEVSLVGSKSDSTPQQSQPQPQPQQQSQDYDFDDDIPF